MYRIKSLRLEQNLSQSALAKRIGSSQKAVDYWEKGCSEPTAKFIIALADCFECSADYLLGREDDYGNINIDSNLKDEEKYILNLFRAFDGNKRRELVRFAKFLKYDG